MTKRILVIADIHGLNVWKKLIDTYEHDKVIFLGDFTDSFEVPDSNMINNLIDIIQYKKDNPDSTVLLLGNHDIQYIYDGQNCSGRRGRLADRLKSIYTPDLNLFKIAHQEGDYLFTHAGIAKGWYNVYKDTLEFYGETIAEGLNNMFNSHERDILFQVGQARQRRHNYGGPLWSDMSEKKLEINQIVGHTPVKHSEKIGMTTYCDTLEWGDGVPLVINI